MKNIILFALLGVASTVSAQSATPEAQDDLCAVMAQGVSVVAEARDRGVTFHEAMKLSEKSNVVRQLVLLVYRYPDLTTDQMVGAALSNCQKRK